MKSVPKISDFGEFSLIERIKKIVPEGDKEELQVSLGDDTAVICITEDRAFLVTCDIQVQDQHFRLDYISPYQLGRRAMAVNLSDIAAMGGKPLYALVSLGLPDNLEVTFFDDLFRGMSDQLAPYDAFVIGGNLARSKEQLIVDISMLGEVDPRKVLTRNVAQLGDCIYISGYLGASAAGFYLMEKYGKAVPAIYDPLVQAHLQPQPRLHVAQLLANSDMVHAMIDVSDGLASDMNHICQMSSVGAEIHIHQIPVHDLHKEMEEITSKSPFELALRGGEDYELLFTVREDAPSEIFNQITEQTGIPLTEIGRIVTKEAGLYTIDQHERKELLQPKGWDHFKSY
jgi:thiamine-monophosphate kinase